MFQSRCWYPLQLLRHLILTILSVFLFSLLLLQLLHFHKLLQLLILSTIPFHIFVIVIVNVHSIHKFHKWRSLVFFLSLLITIPKFLLLFLLYHYRPSSNVHFFTIIFSFSIFTFLFSPALNSTVRVTLLYKCLKPSLVIITTFIFLIFFFILRLVSSRSKLFNLVHWVSY